MANYPQSVLKNFYIDEKYAVEETEKNDPSGSCRTIHHRSDPAKYQPREASSS